MRPPVLLSVPNVSEGRDESTIAEIGRAFAGGEGSATASSPAEPGGEDRAYGVRLLDVHSDRDHHRSVFTIAGHAGELGDALIRGARAAVGQIDVMARATGEPAGRGQHPHVGALDVMPIVYLEEVARGAACAEALVVGDRIGQELGVPVFLYGELSADEQTAGRTRAELRRGGIAMMIERLAGGEPGATRAQTEVLVEALEQLRPDFGPRRMHASAGATLVAARPPLVAFNLQLAPPATLDDARAIAALIREGGREGLPGLRAIGVELGGQVAQVSMNVERPLEVSLAMVIAAVQRHARVAGAELVGLLPRAALEGMPEDVPIAGFDPARHVIENALGS
jgi:glutamate formiminotransferase / 5-formyltetrahydrofolate cyclo-ligase